MPRWKTAVWSVPGIGQVYLTALGPGYADEHGTERE
ncbi:hypothetical protein ECJURUA2010_5165, partial [Escherichia coli Jurua 20/10]